MNRKLIRKIDMETTKVEDKVSQAKKDIKTSYRGVKMGFLSIVAGVVLAFITLVMISHWYDENRLVFQFPIVWKIQPMVYVEKRNKEDNLMKIPVIITPTSKPIKPLTKQEIVNQAKYANLIDKIWVLESGRGSNPDGLRGECEGQGLSNEFGYAAQCFPDFNTTVSKIDKWIDKLKVQGWTDAEVLCYYNLGVKQVNCVYYQQALTL